MKEKKDVELETVSVFNLVRYTTVKDYYELINAYSIMLTSDAYSDFVEAFKLFKQHASILYYKLAPKREKFTEDIDFVRKLIFVDGNIPKEASKFKAERKKILEACEEVVSIFGNLLEKLGYTNVEFIEKSTRKSAILEELEKIERDIPA